MLFRSVNALINRIHRDFGHSGFCGSGHAASCLKIVGARRGGWLGFSVSARTPIPSRSDVSPSVVATPARTETPWPQSVCKLLRVARAVSGIGCVRTDLRTIQAQVLQSLRGFVASFTPSRGRGGSYETI
ncbi:hypothetical protein Sulac_0452 [Sulfobacillus acidophilus DSM 10332]|uniref:Uncharacterized protein n=1 Tax=Sulfobacillus acidophilus (strain ATCC 700253 / DSM 10332 / NAL) TaxID=679936 RepID=G8TYP5_SULAD|nr:hypothetical protein Sulac_0452 [Sulfobacillus acidophilus DSM 10332]